MTKKERLPSNVIDFRKAASRIKGRRYARTRQSLCDHMPPAFEIRADPECNYVSWFMCGHCGAVVEPAEAFERTVEFLGGEIREMSEALDHAWRERKELKCKVKRLKARAKKAGRKGKRV